VTSPCRIWCGPSDVLSTKKKGWLAGPRSAPSGESYGKGRPPESAARSLVWYWAYFCIANSPPKNHNIRGSSVKIMNFQSFGVAIAVVVGSILFSLPTVAQENSDAIRSAIKDGLQQGFIEGEELQSIRTSLTNDKDLKSKDEVESQVDRFSDLAERMKAENGFPRYITLAIGKGLALYGAHAGGADELTPDVEDILAASENIDRESAYRLACAIGEFIMYRKTESWEMRRSLRLSDENLRKIESINSTEGRVAWIHEHVSQTQLHGQAKAMKSSTESSFHDE
jgi:hypothetical protein